MRLLGIDGCRAGWLYVGLDTDTGECTAGILPAIEEILGFAPVPAVVAIDIPIGLTDSGPRLCEREARKLLGRPRSSSVFPSPVREVLGAASFREACRRAHRIDGRKINRQTWNIIPKIREVDAFLDAYPEWRRKIHEVHPEVSFRAWNRGVAMAHAKKTAQGRAERQRLVVSHFHSAHPAALARLPRGGWGKDDLVDAFAALWTARRVADGAAVAIPSEPTRDRLGLRMEIVF